MCGHQKAELRVGPNVILYYLSFILYYYVYLIIYQARFNCGWFFIF